MVLSSLFTGISAKVDVFNFTFPIFIAGSSIRPSFSSKLLSLSQISLSVCDDDDRYSRVAGGITSLATSSTGVLARSSVKYPLASSELFPLVLAILVACCAKQSFELSDSFSFRVSTACIVFLITELLSFTASEVLLSPFI